MKIAAILITLFIFTSSALCEPPSKEKILTGLIESQNALEKKIGEKELELANTLPGARYDELESEIEKNKEQLQELSDNFISIASGNDVKVTEVSSKEKFSFEGELASMAQPLILELKKITQTPREISSLENQIEGLTIQIAQVSSLLDSLQKSSYDNEQIQNGVKANISKLSFQKNILESNLTLLQERLALKLSHKKSFTQSVTDVFKIFFESRARNLFVAILVTGIFWFVMRKFHTVTKSSLILDKSQQILSDKLLSLIFLFLTYAGSILVFLFCLFIFNDWLLLIIGTLIIIGIAWTSRYALPRFWQQAGLLLNFGPVREGEKIIFNGIPMLVESLRLYCTLYNPRILDSRIMLPLSDLITYRSRVCRKDEIWFPTKIGDWVRLSDGTYGVIDTQTMETISVKIPGNSYKYFQTSNFIELNPEVLSNGFRLSSTIGIDYKHKEIDEIVATITSGLDQLPEDILLEIVSRKIEFKCAAASSLDFEIIIDFSGRIADRYFELKRVIQKVITLTCIQNDYVIPFPQMELHITKYLNQNNS